MMHSSSSSLSSSSSFDTINTGHSSHGSHNENFSSSSSSLNRWFPIPCNKCRQPINDTAFICSCDCLFCEECTYNHFESNPNCPSCGRLLGENDFTEVTISDPDSKISNDPNEIVQSLLTKTSKQLGTTIAWNDLCAALIREHQVQEKNIRFFVNQFVRETERKIEEGQNAMSQVHVYQKQLSTYKRDIIDFQRRHEENTERLRQKDRQLVEKDRQIQQLKSILAHNSISTIENGGRSTGSGLTSFGAPGSSSSALSSGIYQSHHRGFQTYVRKKEERELAQERDLMNLSRKKNIIMSGRQQR